MKTETVLLFLIVISALFAACSSSDETAQQGTAGGAQQPGTSFMTNQDTLVASMSTQSKPATRSTPGSGDNAEVAFTVQIGAYTQPHHALQAQQLAKTRFTTYLVFNQYEPSLKLYRVSIGKFETREEASRIMRHIMFSYPKEYVECWLNTVAK